MDLSQILSIVVSGLGLFGGFFAYILGLRIRADIDKRLNDMFSSQVVVDKILGVVNGKYVRTDLYLQYVTSTNDKIAAMKELVQTRLDQLGQDIETQISDIKDRL